VGDLPKQFATQENGYQCRASLKTKSRLSTLAASELHIRGCNITSTRDANKDNGFFRLESGYPY
jgi:hypothetical protein